MNILKNQVTFSYQNLKSELNIEALIDSQLPGWQARLTRLMTEYGDQPIGELTEGLFAQQQSVVLLANDTTFLAKMPPM